MISDNRFADALRHGMELSKAIEDGEPVYYFARGQGWVPTVGPVEVQVKENEVQVGDVILQWQWSNGVISDRYDTGWKVHNVTDKYIGAAASPQFHRINGSINWFLVRRK